MFSSAQLIFIVIFQITAKETNLEHLNVWNNARYLLKLDLTYYHKSCVNLALLFPFYKSVTEAGRGKAIWQQ